MKLVSVNTGLPRDVTWHGRNVTTAIFKHPVGDRVALGKFNLDGDRQADLSVHGGEHKAVYCYPIEHYPSSVSTAIGTRGTIVLDASRANTRSAFGSNGSPARTRIWGCSGRNFITSTA